MRQNTGQHDGAVRLDNQSPCPEAVRCGARGVLLVGMPLSVARVVEGGDERKRESRETVLRGKSKHAFSVHQRRAAESDVTMKYQYPSSHQEWGVEGVT